MYNSSDSLKLNLAITFVTVQHQI